MAANAATRYMPLEVSLELTYRCNFHCLHCYLTGRRETKPLPFPRTLALLDELAEAGTLFLTVSGGEPLLHPRWRDVVRHARRRTFAVRLLTNGSLVSDEVAEFLAEHAVWVSVSIYAADAPTFDTVTGVPGSFARVLAGVHRLLRAGVQVSFKLPLLRANAGVVADVARLAATLGVPWSVYPLLTHGRGGERHPLTQRLTPQELGLFLASWPAKGATPGVAQQPRTDVAPCAAGIRTATISPSGEVLACAILPPVAGNVAHKPFSEVWQKSHWLQYLRTVRGRDLRPCGSCPRLAYCGRCAARALVEGQGVTGADPLACITAEWVEQLGQVGAGERAGMPSP